MKFIKNNTITIIITLSTIILAGVAIFTAVRLYQLRSQGTSVSKAWDCSKYTFSVSKSGKVTVVNNSSRSESSQQAKVKINGTEVQTVNVPALAKGQSADLGTVTVPANGVFTWEVKGTKDCQGSGQYTDEGGGGACTSLSFSLTTPTGTPTSTPTGTPTGSPTSSPTGSPTSSPTGSPTTAPTGTPTTAPTSTPTATATSTPGPGATDTPRPTATATTKSIAAAPTSTPTQEKLPEAGLSLPTLTGIGAGILLILGALLLAL